MAQYSEFIEHNVATAGAKRIGIYNSDGNRVGQIPLGSLKMQNTGQKLYSFAAIADPHVGRTEDSEGVLGLKKALQYFAANDDISFVCVCGDLVGNSFGDDKDIYGTEEAEKIQAEKLGYYQGMIDEHAKGKPVYSVTGNHELASYWYQKGLEQIVYGEGDGTACIASKVNEDGTYEPVPCYVVQPSGSNDVFIMLNSMNYNSGKEEDPETGTIVQVRDECQQYAVVYLKRIDEVFYEYRNKRCFVFHHQTPLAGHVDPDDQLESAWYLPLSFWEHYKNVTVFHGHSHFAFARQIKDLGDATQADDANYGDVLGDHSFRSVHIPTLSPSVWQCYIVDVYQNGIHLRGYDFKTDEFVPYASYWVNTNLVDMSDAGNYWTADKFA